MTSSLDMKQLALGVFCTLLTAVLAWFGAGLFPIWPLMWFAPLPVLVFALRSRTWWGAALVAATGWCLGNLEVSVYYMTLGGPPILMVLIVGPMIVACTSAVLLFRAFARRNQVWLALFAFPSCWVALEFINSRISVHGTFGSLAYTQLDFLPFLQLASLTGPWGMSFLLLLFSAAVALGLHRYRSAPPQAWRIVGCGCGAIAVVLAFGTVRLALPAPGQPVKVGLIASDPPNSPEVADPGAPTARLMSRYAIEANKLVAQGAQVIVLPEKLAVIVDSDTRALDAQYQSLSDLTRVPVVAGFIHVVRPLRYNEARLYTPRAPVQTYDKEHLLPPFESNLTPGKSLLTLREPAGIWGVAICKDMDFRRPAQDYGNSDAGLLLVPAWDFIGDRWTHGHIAVMRGVEDGFAIARNAKQGFLTVSDNRGRILAETTSYSAPFATLIAEVPAVHDWTLYQRWGDWFGWVTLGLLLLSLGIVFAAPRRSSHL